MVFVDILITSFFVASGLTPLSALLLIPVAGYFFFKSVSGNPDRTSESKILDDEFEFSIRSNSNKSIDIGLCVPKHLSASDVSRIFMKALPVICQYDKDIIRLLMFQCHETLEHEESTSDVIERVS